MKNLIIGVFLCVIIVGISASVWHGYRAQHADDDRTPGDNESYESKIERYRATAETAARVACTNEVTGLRNIINLEVETSDQNFMNWSASATVEYINALGGVDRTNIELKFDPGYSGQSAWFKKS